MPSSVAAPSAFSRINLDLQGYNGEDSSDVETPLGASEMLERAIERSRVGLFGLLFVIDKEAYESVPLTILEYTIEFFQILGFPLSLSAGFAWPDEIVWLQEVAQWFTFENNLNGNVTAFYVLLTMLGLVLMNAFWVAYSFSGNNIRFIFTLKLLRSTCTLFVTVLYIPILTIFTSIVVNCNDNTISGSCWDGLYLFRSIATIIVGIFFISLSLIVAASFYDPNAASKNVSSKPHARMDLVHTVVRTILTIMFVASSTTPYSKNGPPVPPVTWMLVITSLVGTMILTIGNIWYMPLYHFSWAVSRAVSCSLVAWTSIVLVFVQLRFNSGYSTENFGIALLFSLPIIATVVVMICRERRRWLLASPLSSLKSSFDIELKLRFILDERGLLHNPKSRVILNEYEKAILSKQSSAGADFFDIQDFNTTSAAMGTVSFNTGSAGGVGVGAAGIIASATSGSAGGPANTSSIEASGLGKCPVMQTSSSARVGFDRNKVIPSAEDIFQDISEMYSQATNLLPSGSLLQIFRAQFSLSHMNNTPLALACLAKAEALNPRIDESFVIYRWRKLLSETFHTTSSPGTKIDVISFVAYEQHLQLASKYYRRALRAQLRFWAELSKSSPELRKMYNAGAAISHAISMATSHFGQVVRLNSSSVNVLRLYSGFIRDALNDPKGAKELQDRADELEENPNGIDPARPKKSKSSKRRKQKNRNSYLEKGSEDEGITGSDEEGFMQGSDDGDDENDGEEEDDDDDESDMDDNDDSGGIGSGINGNSVKDAIAGQALFNENNGVLSISGENENVGTILSANPRALKILGYRQQEFVGKNISIIVPRPFNVMHDSFLRRFLATGKGKIVDKTRKVIAINRKGYLVAIWLCVRQVTSELGKTSFLGIISPVISNRKEEIFCVDRAGNVIHFSQGAPSMFGLNITPRDAHMPIATWVSPLTSMEAVPNLQSIPVNTDTSTTSAEKNPTSPSVEKPDSRLEESNKHILESISTKQGYRFRMEVKGEQMDFNVRADKLDIHGDVLYVGRVRTRAVRGVRNDALLIRAFNNRVNSIGTVDGLPRGANNSVSATGLAASESLLGSVNSLTNSNAALPMNFYSKGDSDSNASRGSNSGQEFIAGTSNQEIPVSPTASISTDPERNLIANSKDSINNKVSSPGTIGSNIRVLRSANLDIAHQYITEENTGANMDAPNPDQINADLSNSSNSSNINNSRGMSRNDSGLTRMRSLSPTTRFTRTDSSDAETTKNPSVSPPATQIQTQSPFLNATSSNKCPVQPQEKTKVLNSTMEQAVENNQQQQAAGGTPFTSRLQSRRPSISSSLSNGDRKANVTSADYVREVIIRKSARGSTRLKNLRWVFLIISALLISVAIGGHMTMRKYYDTQDSNLQQIIDSSVRAFLMVTVAYATRSVSLTQGKYPQANTHWWNSNSNNDSTSTSDINQMILTQAASLLKFGTDEMSDIEKRLQLLGQGILQDNSALAPQYALASTTASSSSKFVFDSSSSSSSTNAATLIQGLPAIFEPLWAYSLNSTLAGGRISMNGTLHETSGGATIASSPPYIAQTSVAAESGYPQQALWILQVLPVVPMFQLGSSSLIAVDERQGLINAMSIFISRAQLVFFGITNASSTSSSSSQRSNAIDDVEMAFVCANGLGPLLLASETSSELYLRYLVSYQFDNKTWSIWWSCTVAIGSLLLTYIFGIRPLFDRIEDSKTRFLKMFRDIPKSVVRAIYEQCFSRLENLLGESETEAADSRSGATLLPQIGITDANGRKKPADSVMVGDAANLSGDGEGSNGPKAKQERRSFWGTIWHYIKERGGLFPLRNQHQVNLKISLLILMTFVYFLTPALIAHIMISDNLISAASSFRAASQVAVLVRGLRFHLREGVLISSQLCGSTCGGTGVSNKADIAALTNTASDLAQKLIDLVNALENLKAGLMFGGSTLEPESYLRPPGTLLTDSSDSSQNNLMMTDACPWVNYQSSFIFNGMPVSSIPIIDPVSACSNFDNGIAQHGLYATIYEISQKIRTAVNDFTAEINATLSLVDLSSGGVVNMTNATAAALAQHHAAIVSDLDILDGLDGAILDGPMRASMELYISDLYTSSDRFVLAHLIVTICYVVLVIAFYFLLYRPLITTLGEDVKRTYVMLCMIPIEVIEKVESIAQFVSSE